MRSLVFILFGALVISSLALVHTRHMGRVKFVELQKLQSERDRLNVEWSQLQVEKRTYTEHGRVEKHAREKLGMVIPKPEDLVIVTQVTPGNGSQ